MPILSNPRWEAFCKYTAMGKTRADAYIAAGFEPKNKQAATHRGSALFSKPSIKARVSEWEAEIQSQSAASEALTRDFVVEQLIENVEMAKSAKPILDREGNPSGEYKVELAAANRALELLGKEKGMFVDRIQFEGLDAELEGMDGKKLRDFVRGLASEIGIRMVDSSPEQTREWIIRNAPRVGLRVSEESSEAPHRAEDEEASGVSAVPETGSLPPPRIH